MKIQTTLAEVLRNSFFNSEKPKIIKINDDDIVIGGYYFFKKKIKLKALITKTKNSELFLFYPINDDKKILFFPCKTISDKTLNGFMNAKNNEFIGFRGRKMKKMEQGMIDYYVNEYNVSCDPSYLPNGWN